MVLLFFFFQAEDGIRDGHVTGVQTCALPIFDRERGTGGVAGDLRPPRHRGGRSDHRSDATSRGEPTSDLSRAFGEVLFALRQNSTASARATGSGGRGLRPDDGSALYGVSCVDGAGRRRIRFDGP